jgi:tetratricopeptide (TPR) repeat protein
LTPQAAARAWHDRSVSLHIPWLYRVCRTGQREGLCVSIEQTLRSLAGLQQKGAWDEAERILQQLLRQYPANVDVHRAMALQASHTDRAALALEHMGTAFKLAPHSMELGFQLGCLQAHAGDYAQALGHFQRTTTQSPGFADGWYFLGIALLRLKRDAEALTALRNAYRLAPTHAKALKALADLEFRIGYPADALPLLRALAQAHPDDLDTCLKTGETLSRLGYHADAIASYKSALQRQPDAADLWMALAQAEEDNGDRHNAEAAYLQALALKPGWAFPLSGLLGLQRGKASVALIEQATQLQASASVPDPDRALIGYELGKVHDGRGEYAAAMASWHDANAARQRMIGTANLEHLQSTVDRTMQFFQPALFDRLKAAGSPDPRMVFIVGMPRSGTTLTEQIIASHPQAFGCGELPDMALIVRNLPVQLATRLPWPDLVMQLDAHVLANAVERYTEAATRHAPAEAMRLVDKAPLNFFHLGLVALMFPHARVVWCRRDPRDIAVSIYGENFSLEEKMATRLDGIGHYINMQNKLMRHWQSVLPLPILELQYEALVAGIDDQAKRLVSFIGLPWDDACLDFHQSDRGVQTPSRWQVKQPVHTRSVGRWRNYEASLAPLLDVLDPGSY